ncbi:hypothetical protein [Lactococcus lactis]
MAEEEIALRLVEAWVGQSGLPVSFDGILKNYEESLEKVQQIIKKMR